MRKGYCLWSGTGQRAYLTIYGLSVIVRNKVKLYSSVNILSKNGWLSLCSPWTWALGEFLLALTNSELCWKIFNRTQSNFCMFHSKGQAGKHGSVEAC